MQLLQPGHRDDRRRRVLNETSWNSPPKVGGRRAPGGVSAGGDAVSLKDKPYGDAAFMEEQPRLTDLVPLRLSLYLIPLVLGLAIIAGLEFLYAWSGRVASLTTDGCVAALDLDSEGSVATWFSSMLLMFAGLAAVLVYLVRRHRTDDYQGDYRVWLWGAACCLLMSVDEGSSLHEGFKELMAYVTGTRLFGDGSIWWVIPYFFLLGAVGARLVLEMRPCRLSTATMVGVAACFGAAVMTQLGWILPESGARGVMLEEGAEMVANLLLLLAFTLHARHVILEAKGLLPQRKPEADDSEDDVAEEESSNGGEEGEGEDEEEPGASSITVHPPHGIPRPASPAIVPARAAQVSSPVERRAAKAVGRTKSVAATKPATPPMEAEDEESEALAHRKLTKAERKAMRRRLAEMRAAREERLRGE